MLQARWEPTEKLRPEQRHPDTRPIPTFVERDRELFRAYCGKGRGRESCGGVVGHYWFNDLPGRREVFRLPPWFAWCPARDLLYGEFYLPERPKRQQRRAALEGVSPRDFRPVPRRHRTGEEIDWAAEAVAYAIGGKAIPGVVGNVGGPSGRGDFDHAPQYLVDPTLTGGKIVARCPRCDWQNGVGPPPVGEVWNLAWLEEHGQLDKRCGHLVDSEQQNS